MTPFEHTNSMLLINSLTRAVSEANMCMPLVLNNDILRKKLENICDNLAEMQEAALMDFQARALRGAL